jgi:hypothetical protein
VQFTEHFQVVVTQLHLVNIISYIISHHITYMAACYTSLATMHLR